MRVLIFLVIVLSAVVVAAQENGVDFGDEDSATQELCIPLELARRVNRALDIGERYSAPGHTKISVDLVYIPPSDALRREADRMDQHDEDFAFFEDVVREWKEYIGVRKAQEIR